MRQNVVSQIGTWVEEYGHAFAVDVSDWTTTFSQYTCMVLGVPDIDQARAMSAFLQGRGMMAEVVPPTTVVADWGVVAVPK